MLISTNWVKDYIEIDTDLKHLADKITESGVNIEKIESNQLKGLVIGKILEVVNHPDSDHLHIVKVDIKDEILEIVCGAMNVRKDLKVIVAKVGAILPGNFEIKKSMIRGVESSGMICALFEIGLEEKNDENYNKGIAELPGYAEVGMDAISYFGLDDTIYTLDLNPNRNDCLSHIGFAYEVAAVTGKKVTMPDTSTNEIDEKTDFHLDIKTNNCDMYCAKIVKDVVIKESPEFIKKRLTMAGMRPINNVVDISNYIMLEYGQPLHFFDKDLLGNNILVRMALETESTITLDGKQRQLTNQDIVITSDNNIVAIAGVMGCNNTSVNNSTKNILIESAIFNPYHIRKTSINLDLRSESSLRYEKGLNPDYCILALKRACHLLEKYASGKVIKETFTYNNIKLVDKKTIVNKEEINSLLGMNLKNEDIKNSLNNLQFEYKEENDNYTITIPNRRMDIGVHKADMIEEIGRLYGYNKLENKLPIGPTKPGKYIGNVEIRKEISKRLRSLGLNECRTYTLINETDDKLFHYNREESISLLRPLSEDKKIIRQSVLSSLIHVYEYNKARNMKDIFVYEIANTYANEMTEDTKVALLLKGNYLNSDWQGKKIEADFYLLKGIIENLFDYLGYKNRYSFVKNTLKDMHPGMSAEILIDKEPIGFLGKTNPRVSDVFVCEFSLTKLSSKKVKSIKHKEVSKYPSITKDLAFIMDKNITSEEVSNVLKKIGGRLLTNTEVFDVYTGENIEENKKSIAYSLTFQDENRTLTEKEVMTIVDKMIKEATLKLGIILRDK